MKKHFITSLALFLPLTAFGELVFLKDGKVHTTKEIRRDGNFLLFKSLAPTVPSQTPSPRSTKSIE